MAYFASPFWRWKGASIIVVTCAAMLSAPDAVADTELFGLGANSTEATPVEINPTTGIVTLLTSHPVVGFVGNTFDVVSSANTLYITSDRSPNLLFSVDSMTGAVGTIPLTLPSACRSSRI